MSKYQKFIFKDYRLDGASKTLSLTYSYDGQLDFTETYKFDFDWQVPTDDPVLDRAIQNLFFMAGVSYYKAYLAPEIIVAKGELDKVSADFFSRTYQKGLGEFFYVNSLDPHTTIDFPVTVPNSLNTLSNDGEGLLVGLGGGKDSLVTAEILRTAFPLTTWMTSRQEISKTFISRVGLPHLWIKRTVSEDLLRLNQEDTLNGHIPISAIFACLGTVLAILSGNRDVVVSNEQSANEPTLHYQGVAINHQYSKSEEFERDYQKLLRHHYGDTLRYYSFLRPLSELRIAELFAHLGFDKYKDTFTSCNVAARPDSHVDGLWCGHCPKCAFVFLALTPFVPKDQLTDLWHKNLLLDPSLEPTYRQLLGIEGDKPLECVGEIKESRAAMRLAEVIYPELKDRYKYDLPDDYDYKRLGSHAMPSELYAILQKYL